MHVLYNCQVGLRGSVPAVFQNGALVLNPRAPRSRLPAERGRPGRRRRIGSGVDDPEGSGGTAGDVARAPSRGEGFGRPALAGSDRPVDVSGRTVIRGWPRTGRRGVERWCEGGARPWGGAGAALVAGRFILKASDDGGTAGDVAKAPFRGEGFGPVPPWRDRIVRWTIRRAGRVIREDGPGRAAQAGLCGGRRPTLGGRVVRRVRGRAVYLESPGRRRDGGRHRQGALPGGGFGAASGGPVDRFRRERVEAPDGRAVECRRAMRPSLGQRAVSMALGSGGLSALRLRSTGEPLSGVQDDAPARGLLGSGGRPGWSPERRERRKSQRR